MKKFSFEKFTLVGGAFAPMISVRKDGGLGISQGALRKFELIDGDHFVVLHFDKDANAIGIKITKDDSEEGAIKLVKREGPGKPGQQSISASISARAFLEFYGIDKSETKSYRAFKDEESGLIVIELNAPEKESTDG